MTIRTLASERKNFSRWASALFFSFFFLLGLISFSVLGRLFWQDVRTFLVYAPGACTITAKQLLESEDSDDGPTYCPDFNFTVKTSTGATYPARGYRRNQRFSSGKRGQQALVNHYEVGQTYPCWYDPQNPTQAVLMRGFGWLYLFGLIPLAFAAFGLGGVIVNLRRTRQSTEASALKQRRQTAPPHARSVAAPTCWPALTPLRGTHFPYRLPPAMSHKTMFWAAVGMAVFWNLIVGVFVIAMLKGLFPWGMWLFLTPFILVGGYLIYQAGRAVLKVHMSGETFVEIAAEPVFPGQRVGVFVEQRGRLNVQEFQVKLIGREHITYRRGTDTYREQHTLFEELVSAADAFVISTAKPYRQKIQIAIPAEAMHSFKTRSNEITWQITIAVKATGAPDFELDFPFRVAPVSMGAGGRG